MLFNQDKLDQERAARIASDNADMLLRRLLVGSPEAIRLVIDAILGNEAEPSLIPDVFICEHCKRLIHHLEHKWFEPTKTDTRMGIVCEPCFEKVEG